MSKYYTDGFKQKIVALRRSGKPTKEIKTEPITRSMPLAVNEAVPVSYSEVSLVCLRQDRAYESPATVSLMCNAIKNALMDLKTSISSFQTHIYKQATG